MGHRVYYREPIEPSVIPAKRDLSCQDPLSSAILGYSKHFDLLVACSEPGYCSDSCLKEVVMLASRSGMQTFSRDFSKLNSANATAALVKFTRTVRTKIRGVQVYPFVLIAGLPASDESELARQATAIGKLVSSGCTVICTILPEARQLLEEVSGYALLTAEDMSDFPFGDESCGEGAGRLTHGIPSLSRANAAEPQQGSKGVLGDAYLNELGRLAGQSLRPGLLDDELMVRLSMIILGEGSFDEVGRAVGFDPSELMADAAVWAPFFGVSSLARSFQCLTGVSDLWLGAESGRLDEVSRLYEDVALKSLLILGEKGAFTRIERFLTHVPRELRLKVLEEFGPELLDSGCIGAVCQALSSAPREWLDRLSMLKAACEALGSERIGSRAGALAPEVLPSRDEVSMLCMGLIAMRDGLRGEAPAYTMLANNTSGLQRRLYAHAEAVGLMMSGNFMHAVESLVPFVGDEASETLTGRVLSLDMALARTMSCGGAWRTPPEARECEAYLKERGYMGLLGHVWACDLVFAALCGEDPRRAVAVLRAKAAKSGDRLVKTVSIAAEAMLLAKNKPSAYVVAATKAAEGSCESIGWGYGARVMRVFGQVARFRLGETAPLHEVEGTDPLGVVSALVHDACCDAMGENPLIKRGEGCPRDAMWLLVYLSEGVGEFSEALEEQVPVEWRRSLEIVRRACVPAAQKREGVAPGNADAASLSADGVRINVLGEFSLWACGRRVSDRNLVARDAMRLLEYLALQRGHLASRPRLAGDLWPEVSDERKGLQKVYAATNVVRKALVLHGYDEELFVSNRTTSVISLATDVLACDVDEFLSYARTAQDSASDAKSCAAALRAEALYTGDLYMPAADGTAYFTAARESLRETYADAMVAGAEAALRLDRGRLAVRLASNALSVDDLREDATAVLVRSLRSVGRGAEALHAYQSYERRLLSMTGTEPSRQLKRALNEPSVLVRPAPAILPARASATAI